MLGEYYRETRCCAQVLLAARRRPCRWLWGFCTTRSLRGRVAGVSDPHVVQFPPIGRSEAATHSGVVPKVQTTSSK